MPRGDQLERANRPRFRVVGAAAVAVGALALVALALHGMAPARTKNTLQAGGGSLRAATDAAGDLLAPYRPAPGTVLVVDQSSLPGGQGKAAGDAAVTADTLIAYAVATDDAALFDELIPAAGQVAGNPVEATMRKGDKLQYSGRLKSVVVTDANPADVSTFTSLRGHDLPPGAIEMTENADSGGIFDATTGQWLTQSKGSGLRNFFVVKPVVVGAQTVQAAILQ